MLDRSMKTTFLPDEPANLQQIVRSIQFELADAKSRLETLRRNMFARRTERVHANQLSLLRAVAEDD